MILPRNNMRAFSERFAGPYNASSNWSAEKLEVVEKLATVAGIWNGRKSTRLKGLLLHRPDHILEHIYTNLPRYQGNGWRE